jgi:ribonuclease PH
MTRTQRTSSQIRPVQFIPEYTKYALGSVLAVTGDTKVLCTVHLEDQLPPWLRQGKKPAPHGWLSAEYSMLPSATQSRTKRERPAPSGRSQEIQRLIGRSLRGILDLTVCPELSLMVDCDVIQADGGTRTAGINGAYVALEWAFHKLLKEGRIKKKPIVDRLAAFSLGIKNGEILLDLDYGEDSTCDVDLNLVMTHGGDILEIQGAAEKKRFTSREVTSMIEVAQGQLPQLIEAQQKALVSLLP